MSVHPEPPGESCVLCARLDGESRPATHKMGEDALLYMHNLTTYLCCAHFRMVGCDCATYPYAVALTNPFPARDPFGPT